MKFFVFLTECNKWKTFERPQLFFSYQLDLIFFFRLMKIENLLDRSKKKEREKSYQSTIYASISFLNTTRSAHIRSELSIGVRYQSKWRRPSSHLRYDAKGRKEKGENKKQFFFVLFTFPLLPFSPSVPFPIHNSLTSRLSLSVSSGREFWYFFV